MNLRPETSPIDGIVHAANITYLQAASVATNFIQLQTQLSGIFSGSEAYILQPSTSLLPRTTIVADIPSRSLLVILQGMINFDKVAACIQGWFEPASNLDGFLYPFQSAARQIINIIPPLPVGSFWQQIYIVGHSYGGAVAPWLLYDLPSQNGQTAAKCYTYGAPKPRRSGSFGVAVTGDCRRVFLSNDPVPLLPLSYDQWGNLWTLTGVPTARAWTLWQQPMSGLTINADNDMEWSINPAFQGVQTGLLFTLGGWLTGSNAFGSNNHSLGAYAAAIALVPAVTVDNVQPRTVVDVPPIVRPTSLQLQQSQGVALVQAGQAANASPNDTLIGIQSGTQLQPDEVYHGKEIDKQQVIIYNGAIVAYVATRRLRRAMVRTLNRQLRTFNA